MGWAVVVYAGMVVLGWSGRVLIPVLADKEVIFVAATNQLFPPVVAGIVLAAVLSAIMSTADSQLLVAASAVTHDLGWGSSDPVSNLWHLSVNSLVHRSFPIDQLPGAWVAIAASLVVAALSYASVERPFLRLGARIGRSQLSGR